MVGLRRGRGHGVLLAVQRHRGRLAAVLAGGVGVQVVQDGEQPAAQVGAPHPQVRFAPGALQAVLHQVVGALGVAHQRVGIAPQAWRLLLDQSAEVIHGAIPARRRRGPAAAALRLRRGLVPLLHHLTRGGALYSQPRAHRV